MADTLWNEAYTKEYSNKLIQEAQQDAVMLPCATMHGRIKAEEKFFYQLGALTGTVNRARYADTDSYASEPQYEARRIQDYVLSMATRFDNIDQARTILEPQSPVAIAMRKGIARLKDQIIWNGILGTTLGSGSNTYSLGTDNTVVVGTGHTSNTGMNFKKIVAAYEKMLNNHVMPDSEELSLVIHPQGWNELLNEEKMTSGDYVAAMSIMRGKLNNILGIKNIIVTPTVPYVDGSSVPIMTVGSSWTNKGTAQDAAGGTDIRCCVLVAKSGIQIGTWRDATMTVDRLPTKSNAIQLFIEEQCGAARTEDEKVVKILSDDSP